MFFPSTFDAGVVAALTALDAKSVRHVFFIACGGSLSIMHPAKFLLDQHAPLHEAQLAEDRPQGGALGRIAAVEGRDRGQGVGHGGQGRAGGTGRARRSGRPRRERPAF